MLEDRKKDLAQRGTISLDVRARPGAGQTKIKSIMADGSVKIDIAAEPENGKANAELIRFLADEFDVLKDRVEIMSGHTSGRKRVVVTI
ncbi:MAG: hypothetical protein JWM56_468 [Candidatus Peribacteria bacterium]|nr:hypothetical protein [Candidatus Peribacteria bacterium]